MNLGTRIRDPLLYKIYIDLVNAQTSINWINKKCRVKGNAKKDYKNSLSKLDEKEKEWFKKWNYNTLDNLTRKISERTKKLKEETRKFK